MSTFLTTDREEVPVDEDSEEEFQTRGQIAIILCGLIASGKSTFAQALEEHFPEFRRCNQDDLGNRYQVEQLARRTLNEGLSVCVDRTNFNEIQRSYWIEIARSIPETQIWVIVFDTPYEDCAARLRSRISHPTIKTPEEGLSVLSRFAADFQHPVPREGYHRILYVKPSDHTSPFYSRSDIAAILTRVQNSPLVHSGVLRGMGMRKGHRKGFRGRGGNFTTGPTNDFRPSQNTPYRGNNLGLYGPAGRVWPSSIETGSDRKSTHTLEGDGTNQDPFVVD